MFAVHGVRDARCLQLSVHRGTARGQAETQYNMRANRYPRCSVSVLLGDRGELHRTADKTYLIEDGLKLGGSDNITKGSAQDALTSLEARLEAWLGDF